MLLTEFPKTIKDFGCEVGRKGTSTGWHEVKEQVEKVEKLRREFERKQREQNRKEPDAIGDNPVFDRVRRPLSLSLPRPNELGKRRM